MRLTIRFLALVLLLVIATFPNSSSIATLAVEADNPCFEGCVRGKETCSGRCGYDQNCQNKCRDDYTKCVDSCKSGDLPEAPPEN